MEKNQIRRLPVLDHDNRIVGIVSLGDLAIKDDENRVGVTLERVSEHSRSALSTPAYYRPMRRTCALAQPASNHWF